MIMYDSWGWREPGNMTLQRGRIFGLVLFKRKVTDQEGRPAGQRQSGAGAGRIFLVLFRIIEQDQELVKNSEKSLYIILETVIYNLYKKNPYLVCLLKPCRSLNGSKCTN